MREGLAEGGRGSAGTLWRRFGANLVVVELAVAVVLLAGAGLLGKSFYRLLHVDLGFQPDHLATLQIAAPDVQLCQGRAGSGISAACGKPHREPARREVGGPCQRAAGEL